MAKTKTDLINQQLALAFPLNDEATLSDFCWNNNILLRRQLTSMLGQDGDRLLYLWGSRGCGKSHILQACCREINANQSAIYLPLNMLKEWGTDALEGLEDQDLICIDDIEAIAKSPQWEEAIFHLYNRIKDNEHSLLIISGKLPPAALPLDLPDLRSRLGWGLVLQINELNDEDKIAALKAHALKRGFRFPYSVGQYLINRCSRNMHDLYQLLNHLDEASLAAQRKITIPFVKAMLKI